MLVQLQRNWPVDGPLPHAAAKSQDSFISLDKLWAIFRRRLFLVIGSVVLLLLVGVIYLATTKPLFGSTATLYLDIQNAQMVQGDGNPTSVAPLGLDDENVNSQTLIIESEKIATKVIRDLKLKDLPEFNRPQSLLAGYLSAAMGTVRNLIHFGGTEPALPDSDIPRGVIETFGKRLQVDRVDDTFVLEISFLSEDPQRAADITNAIASAYLEEKLDARYDSVRRASSWLEGRLSELREASVKSDQIVQQYKHDNGIIDTNSGNADGQLLSDTQLNDLSDRLVQAQRDTADKKARYDQIMQMIQSGNPDATVVDALQSSVINQLREQYSEASQLESTIARQYGPDHEAAQKLRSKMQDINGLIVSELRRIAQVYNSDLQVAAKQESDLSRSLDEYKARSAQIAQARVKLRELQRNADADQNLYQSFLDRYKSTLQQESFPITDARILTSGTPARSKSSPKSVITLGLAGIAGLALGLMLAVARELIDGTFRSPAQVEELLNLNCLGVLPQLRGKSARRSKHKAKDGQGRKLPPDLGLLQYAADMPFSRFSETLRAVKLAADFAAKEGRVQVIGVVSSVPGEGKSTVAMNIGELLAGAGNSVLVIDGDLRNPTLSRDAAPQAQVGLLEVLTGTGEPGELVYSDEVKPLKFLPAHGKTAAAHTSDLMGSARMASLLTAARRAYDYVIIDLPPLAPVVDAQAVAGVVDGFVYVVEWGKTSTATVSDALHNAPAVKQKIIGCLLNKADMHALRLYMKSTSNSEYYSHGKLGTYLSHE